MKLARITLAFDLKSSCKPQQSWDQDHELSSGRAALTVTSSDGQFLDAWITIVPD